MKDAQLTIKKDRYSDKKIHFEVFLFETQVGYHKEMEIPEIVEKLFPELKESIKDMKFKESMVF